ncbi:hypothetical protein [Nocardia sp. NPDC050435]|uniref:hypothetical protein n=1 Tax=Nocardia sp. NPDC050435 TaxID=3155040 RepID=UPI0033F49525
MRIGHPHPPWHIERWEVGTISGRHLVEWAVVPAPCPACAHCHGTGTQVIGTGPEGFDAEFAECGCTWPLIWLRVPPWLARMLPGPARRTTRSITPGLPITDEPPF